MKKLISLALFLLCLRGNAIPGPIALPGNIVPSGTAPVVYTPSTRVISVPAASGSQNGYLSSSDWTAFDGKQAAGLDWLLLGNSGTAAGTNFIGTSDSQSLVFKTNGVEAMRIDQPTSRLFVGTSSSIGGSNAGIQYADATTANRGQIKLHSYFNGTSVAGVSTLTSRSGTVGTNTAVVAGQDYSKWTAQAAATTPGSAPISGTFAFKANTINSLTVTSDYHIQLTNLAGSLVDRLYLSSEGLVQLPGYGSGYAQFDSSGNISSVSISNADATHTGFLTSTNWSTFNSKFGSVSITPSTPSRSLATNFTPSASNITHVCYTVNIVCASTLVASCEGIVDLRSDTNATPTTVRGRFRVKLNLGLALSTENEGQICYLVPANHNVRLVSTTVSGSPTFSITTQIESPLAFAQ